MKSETIINIVQTIIVPLLVAWIMSGRLKKSQDGKRTKILRQTKNAIKNDESFEPSMQKPKSLADSPWFFLFLMLFAITFLALEVYRPSELTRMSVYKIAFGVGLFFYIPIQWWIFKTIAIIYRTNSELKAF